MTNPKRSVSPQTVTDDDPAANRSGFGFSSLVSYFKGNSAPVPNPQQTSPNTIEVSIIEDDELMNDFTSEKKRRVSIQGHPRQDSIPRSSTLNNNLGSYKTYYENLKTSKQELNNDLERRLSTVYGDVVKDTFQDSLDPPQTYIKDTSPLDVSRASVGGSILNQLQYEDHEELIEPEFAPLYVDEDGNLVRPPMINLDPRERYQLLQLKRSLELSQSLQKRIKYMVDPKETSSTFQPSTNKVETSTQTTTFSHLSNSLSFSRNKRKLEAKKNLKSSKRQKNNKGFFVGEFYYDVTEEEPEKVSNGYLGSINKPKFKPKESKYNTVREGIDNNKVNLELDPEYLEKSEKISNIIKLKETSGTTKGEAPSSGFQFSINKDDMENIAKRRRDDEDGSKSNPEKLENPESKTEKVPFSFRKENDPTNSKPAFSFGKPEDKTAEKFASISDSKLDEKPKFSFGKIEEKKEAPSFSFSTKPEVKTESKKATPTFNFGEKKEAPAFSFGKKEDKEETSAPKFSFGKDKADKNEEKSAPAFSFGKSNDKSDEKPAPTFSFGKSTEKSDDKPAPKFSFGKDEAKLEEKSTPTFSFGKPTDKSDEKPAPIFSFEKPTEKSDDKPSTSFSFGKAAEKSDEKSTPSFSFGNKDKLAEDKPASSFSFGNTDKPADGEPTPSFSFGNKDKAAADKPAPSFSFGKSGDEDLKRKSPFTSTPAAASGAKPAPAFSFQKNESPFGKKDDVSSVEKSVSPVTFENKAEPKPVFNFGAKANGTTFNFGSKEPAKEANTISNGALGNAPAPSVPNSSFNFGSPAVSDPSTIFGVNAPEKPFAFGQAAAPKPAFSFGNNATPAANTPSKPFSFGAAPANPNFKFAAGINPSPNTGTPKFNFGAQPPSMAGAAPGTGFVSREATATPTFSFNNPNGNPNPNLNPNPNTNVGAQAFNFGSREATPDPATIFSGSRGTTPNFMGNGAPAYQPNHGSGVSAPGFGTNISMPQPTAGAIPFQFGNTVNATPTPPIPSNRKIAQYRLRRR